MSTYKQINEPLDTKYPTWIIAYCPDTDEFFATNERHFFWQTDEEYDTEEDAINCFESHISYYLAMKNRILNDFIAYYKPQDYVWLANTEKKYEVET